MRKTQPPLKLGSQTALQATCLSALLSAKGVGQRARGVGFKRQAPKLQGMHSNRLAKGIPTWPSDQGA